MSEVSAIFDLNWLQPVIERNADRSWSYEILLEWTTGKVAGTGNTAFVGGVVDEQSHIQGLNTHCKARVEQVVVEYRERHELTKVPGCTGDDPIGDDKRRSQRQVGPVVAQTSRRVPFCCARQGCTGEPDRGARCKPVDQMSIGIGEIRLQGQRGGRMPRVRGLKAVAFRLAQIGRVGEAGGCTETHLDIAPVDVKNGRVHLQSLIEPIGARTHLIIPEAIRSVGGRERKLCGRRVDVGAAEPKSFRSQRVSHDVLARSPRNGGFWSESVGGLIAGISKRQNVWSRQ